MRDLNVWVAGEGPRSDATFAIAARDELWIDGRLAERRLSCGSAIDDGPRIVAVHSLDEELIRTCDAAIDEMRPDIDRDARVRLVATARRVRGFVTCEATMTITIGGVSIVGRDATVLREALAIQQTTDRHDLPIVWRNGSAAVLLHEAIGHAAEHEAKPVKWPSWLHVVDLPGFAVDDTGAPANGADLMVAPPACLRRESFRDVPLRRMTNVHVRKHGRPPFQLPRRFIDVYLVAGGAYDPLTDVVTIDVAVSTAGAFKLRRTRAEVAESIAGMTGIELRYPGVICSREGQELAVGSYAPVMITQ